MERTGKGLNLSAHCPPELKIMRTQQKCRRVGGLFLDPGGLGAPG